MVLHNKNLVANSCHGGQVVEGADIRFIMSCGQLSGDADPTPDVRKSLYGKLVLVKPRPLIGSCSNPGLKL